MGRASVRIKMFLDRYAEGEAAYGRLGRRPPQRMPRSAVVGAILFALLAVAPLAWGIMPLPYHFGQVASHDIVARVTVDWRDVEEEQRLLEDIERHWPRRYRESSKWDWTLQVWGAMTELLEKAAAAADAKEILDLAASRDIRLSPHAAETMLHSLAGKRDRVYSAIVAPAQGILREVIFRRGVLNREHYEAEAKRQIRVTDKNGEARLLYVDAASKDSPLEVQMVPSLLGDRLGEYFERDGLDLRLLTVIQEILQQRLTPSLHYDREATQAEMEREKAAILSRTRRINEGEIILGRGGVIDSFSLLSKLHAEEKAWRASAGALRYVGALAGKAIAIFLLALGFMLYAERACSARHWQWRSALATAMVAVLMLVALYALLGLGLPISLLPLGVLAGLLALGLGEQMAMLASVGFAFVMAIILEGHPGGVLAHAASACLFANCVRACQRRGALLATAVGVGMVHGILLIVWHLGVGEFGTISFHYAAILRGEGGAYPFTLALAAGASWCGAGILLLLALPAVEPLFGTPPAIILRQLQDQESPCLRHLVLQAAGTYHHSFMVGALAEAAADAIGADSLLARVGAYYHDIGKLMKPEYFVENESGVSRHESLSPFLSALIIIAHVKDGAEMAAEYNLPRCLIDIIEQHHGRTLVTYFHHRARQQSESAVSEQVFRYPGPLPQSREAAIVMLADSVEAATRSLEHPTPSHLRNLTHQVIAQRLNDGQLDESSLTFEDIRRIEEAFFRVLVRIHHSRVKYPAAE